jgi:hypothetical protein
LSAAYLAACAQDGGGGSKGSGGSTTSAGGSGGNGSGGTTSSGGNGSGGTSAKGGSGGNGSGGSGSGGSGSGGTSAKGGSGGNSSGGSGSGGTTGSGGSGTGGNGTGGSGSGGTSVKGGAGGGTGGGCGSCMGGTTTSPQGSGGLGTGGTGAGGTGTGGTGTGGSTGGLPALKVNGTKLQDPNNKTIILRGSSLIDIGALYVAGGNNIKGITDRMDKLAAAGVQGHVVRLPVYPKIDYNGGGKNAYCSPLPYPVGTGPSADQGSNCPSTATMNAADYVNKVLKLAVDYATTKNLYVIIDHHQIDDATKGTSAADATTFWTDISPKFASYSNVLYELFNEPIDSASNWTALKPVVQGWIDTIRKGAPNNIIIVPSTSYDQHPGDAASSPPSDTKSNLMYTAHVYPGNWNPTFQAQVTTATSKAPVFITEWGYDQNLGDTVGGTSSATWGTDFEALVDGNGASWTAWVTDNGWTPSMFSDSTLTALTPFGTVVKNWLTAKATSDWVQ